MTEPTFQRIPGQALCAQTDPDVWFPEVGGDTRLAKRVCASCELLDPCRDFALHHRVSGVWGGTSEHQRTTHRRQLGIVAINDRWTLAAERSETAQRMHARRTPVFEIARHLNITEEAVQRILRGAA